MTAVKLADAIRGKAQLAPSNAPFFVHPQYQSAQR
jgi:choline dehydrogenase